MAVCFPAEQLTILDYNRVVKDLNGMSEGQFVEALRTDFDVERIGTEIYKPARLHEFSLYVGGTNSPRSLERSTRQTPSETLMSTSLHASYSTSFWASLTCGRTNG